MSTDPDTDPDPCHPEPRYDPVADYRARAATWDPVRELARIRALDLRPACAEVPLADPARALRSVRAPLFGGVR